MLPTFIHKSSQRTFRVVNHSDVPVKFEVKKLADSFLEEEARSAGGEPVRRDPDALAGRIAR